MAQATKPAWTISLQQQSFIEAVNETALTPDVVRFPWSCPRCIMTAVKASVFVRASRAFFRVLSSSGPNGHERPITLGQILAYVTLLVSMWFGFSSSHVILEKNRETLARLVAIQQEIRISTGTPPQTGVLIEQARLVRLVWLEQQRTNNLLTELLKKLERRPR